MFDTYIFAIIIETIASIFALGLIFLVFNVKFKAPELGSIGNYVALGILFLFIRRLIQFYVVYSGGNPSILVSNIFAPVASILTYIFLFVAVVKFSNKCDKAIKEKKKK